MKSNGLAYRVSNCVRYFDLRSVGSDIDFARRGGGDYLVGGEKMTADEQKMVTVPKNTYDLNERELHDWRNQGDQIRYYVQQKLEKETGSKYPWDYIDALVETVSWNRRQRFKAIHGYDPSPSATPRTDPTKRTDVESAYTAGRLDGARQALNTAIRQLRMYADAQIALGLEDTEKHRATKSDIEALVVLLETRWPDPADIPGEPK